MSTLIWTLIRHIDAYFLEVAHVISDIIHRKCAHFVDDSIIRNVHYYVKWHYLNVLKIQGLEIVKSEIFTWDWMEMGNWGL
jgi:hypothetical protein